MTKKTTDKLHEMIRAMAEELVSEELKAAVAGRVAKARPRQLASPLPAPKPGAWTPDEKWKTEFRRCPSCKKRKVVWNGGDASVEEIGVRRLRGVQHVQSWCRKCRAGTNYHNRPRKNHSVNNPA